MTLMKKIENGTDAILAMEEAGHNYTVSKVPLVLPNGATVPDMCATVTDDGRYLGTVGRDFQPVQPVDVYGIAQNMIDLSGGQITKVATLHDGGSMAISIHLQRMEPVTGDVVDLDFLLMAGNNGKMAVQGRSLSTRFFCMNQLPSSTSLFSLKHTVNVLSRMETATKMLAYYNRELTKFQDALRVLTRFRHPEKQALEWFTGLLPAPQKDSKRSASIHENTVETFIELLHDGQGANHPGVRGTGWGSLNALTEWVNHHRSTRVRGDRDPEEVKFTSVTMGSGDQLMQKGLKSLLKIAV